MIEHTYGVIMAGGGGTRLWPLSRRQRPKQVLAFGGKRTLFQRAVDRLAGLLPPERILVVTVAEQAQVLQIQSPEIPVQNFLIEPMPRGTASVVGLAAVALRQRDPHAVMAVVTADHVIENVDYFHQVLRAGVNVACEGYLVTLGITPTFPSTGYGYIQFGAGLGQFNKIPAFRALKFKEKPVLEVAEQFLRAGDHAWNSGMFLWTVEQIVAEIQTHMPELAEKLAEIQSAWNTPDRLVVLQAVWPTITPQTIDFGIMEKASRVAVIPASNLGWNDVGSWESLFEVLPANSEGNIISGADLIGIDSCNNLLFTENEGRLIAAIGVNDLIVVDTGDALLICRRDRAQQVRQVVDQLKKENRINYL